MPPRKKVVPKPFDLGGCQQGATVMERIVDCGALPAGWPTTQSLYVIGCLDKASSQLVRARVKSVLENLRALTEEWRKRVLKHADVTRRVKYKPLLGFAATEDDEKQVSEALRVANVAKNLLLDALEAFAGEAEGHALMEMVKEMNGDQDTWTPMEKQLFHFRYPYIEMAHAVLQQCMICSGQGRYCRCVSQRPTAAALQRLTGPRSDNRNGWHLAPHQDGKVVFMKAACLQRHSLTLDTRERGVRFPVDYEVVRPNDSSLAFSLYSNYVLAKAMLRQIGIYAMHSDAKNIISMYGPTNRFDKVKKLRHSNLQANFNHVQQRPLLLLENRYVDPQFTLQGRLGPKDIVAKLKLMARAHDECGKVLEMKHKEEAAVRRHKRAQWLSDMEPFTRISSKGSVKLSQLLEWLPTLKSTLELAMHIEEGAGSATRPRREYINGAEIPELRERVKLAVWAWTTLLPMDKQLLAAPEAQHSPHAFQYACNLSGGSCPGKYGPWRHDLDSPARVPLSPSWMPYLVAAMHVFDGMSSSWTLDLRICQVSAHPHSSGFNSKLRWALTCTSPAIVLEGDMPQHSFEALLSWHVLLSKGCEKLSSDLGESSNSFSGIIPREYPPRRTIENAEVNRATAKKNAALEELQTYYVSMVGVCLLYKELRAAGLVLCGITPAKLAKALEAEHERWAFKEASPCPRMNSDFARWVCGSDPAQIVWRTGSGDPPLQIEDKEDEIEEVGDDPVDSSDEDAMAPYMEMLEQQRNWSPVA